MSSEFPPTPATTRTCSSCRRLHVSCFQGYKSLSYSLLDLFPYSQENSRARHVFVVIYSNTDKDTQFFMWSSRISPIQTKTNVSWSRHRLDSFHTDKQYCESGPVLDQIRFPPLSTEQTVSGSYLAIFISKFNHY
jgi:hypothetical protein